MNEESIFAAALGKQTADERRAFLDQACAENPAMREQVEALLKASADAGSFLEKPAAELAATVTGEGDSEDEGGGKWALPVLEACDKPDRIGKLGGYEIIEVVGRGGMGAVLRAVDVKLNRVVAVKVMAPELAASPMAVKRFLREAQSAAAVVHDHVVTIHAVDDSGKVPFLVMEFVSGQSLQDKIDRVGALRLAEILRIGMQAASGLAAAHKQGLIHRDVKPANILLENGVERVQITDFGLARAADDLNITKSGQICGTPQYMSPEQAQGHTVDPRSDLFSLGSVLYTMATGRPAFRADSTVAVLRRVCDDAPRPIREINPEVPEWLERIIERLMAKKPEERFQTAGEVAEILSRHLAHVQQPDLVPRPTTVAALPKNAKPASEQASSKWAQPTWLWVFGLLLAVWVPTLELLHEIQVVPADAAFAFLGLFVLWMVCVALWLLPRWMGRKSKEGAADPAGARRLWWNGAVIAVVGGVLIWRFAPSLVLIANNKATVQLALDDPEARFVMLRDGKEYLTSSAHGTLYVVPGVYELRIEPRPGRSVERMSLMHRTLFTGHYQFRIPNPVREFYVDRGDRVTLSATFFDRPQETGSVASASAPEGGPDVGPWVSLFNGRDLTGWVTHPEQPGNWRVENGNLTGTGERSHLFTERGDFADFQLRLEARLSAVANGGVMVRCGKDLDFDLSRLEGTGSVPRGLEVDLHPGTQPEPSGSVWHLGDRQWHQKATGPQSKPGEWIRLEIQMEGSRMLVAINDRPVLAVLPGEVENPRGHIALQLLDSRGTVEYRNIEIRELNRPSETAVPTAAVAPFDADAAKKHQEAWARHLDVPVDYSNSIGMKFRLIPPGEYQRGSTPAEIDAALKDFADDERWQGFVKSEGPQHKVTLARPIYLSIHEVTQEQFQAVMGVNPSHFSAGGEGKEAVAGMNTGRHPVESVSWNEAAEFCAKLSENEKRKAAYFHDKARNGVTLLSGNGYRLPTEAEWEFACRAGTTTRYWNGDQESGLNQAGWSNNNAGGRTHAVGELEANPFGLYDVHGNVWEWVQDWWSAWEYTQFRDKTAVDPQGPQAPGLEHTIRGGGWNSTGAANRSASRLVPSPRFKDLGFRVALPVEAARKALALKAPFTATQAQEQQEAWGNKLGTPVEFANSLGMKLRLIPPGEFMMGCAEKEAAEARKEAKLAGVDDLWADFVERSSQPRHRVRLTQPYFIGMHEVTIGHFKKFTVESRYTPTAERESKEKPGEKKEAIWRKFRDDQPVMYISWDDAREFCLWLSAQEQRTYRIPTEAQWEFACRAGTETRWSFGDDVSKLPEYAWSGQGAIAGPKSVGTLKPNPFGLFDMHGNITEWCVDWHMVDFYARGPVDDPVELTKGIAQGRAHRGGWWSELPTFVRSAARNYHEQDHTGHPFGLRVVLTGGFPKEVRVP